MDSALHAAGETHNPEEAFRVVLVIRAAGLHAGHIGVVEAAGARAALDKDVALVKAERHVA
jgi:hypothetical protein